MQQSKQYILFLSGLDKNVKEPDLHRLFSEYPVSYIKIAKDHSTRESFGYAFVCIKNSAVKAEEILNKFNYEKIPGFKKTMRICWYNVDRSGIKNKEKFNIFVKKIPKTVTHREFHDYYNKFGSIVSLKLAEDEEGESMGYGFVMYETEEAADKAIKETNEVEFHGKKLYVGRFIKNKPKRPIEFNNLFVKNIPKEYSEDKVKAIFSKFGELGSCLIKKPKTEIDNKLPEEKKQQIMAHQYGFICFKKADSAMKAMSEVPFFKLNDTKYNDRLVSLAKKAGDAIPEEQKYRFAVYLIENYENPEKTVESELQEAAVKFSNLLKEFDGNYIIKDKTDRFECCQALKKSEREKKVKAIYEKIKRQIKEKYKLCNLYVKNLPDGYTDKELRDLFQAYGPIRSCKTIRKELLTSYLGIKRSVKVFGYVCFNEKQHAHDAKKALDQSILRFDETERVFKIDNSNKGGNHHKLYVDYHQNKAERSEFLKLTMLSKNANKIGKGKMPGDMVGPFGINKGYPHQGKFIYKLILYFIT